MGLWKSQATNALYFTEFAREEELWELGIRLLGIKLFLLFIIHTVSQSLSMQEQQAVIACSTETEYFEAIESAGCDRLVVVECYAEW